VSVVALAETAEAIAAPPVAETGRRKHRWGVWIAVGWLVLVVAGAVLAPILPIEDPGASVGPARTPPGWRWPEPLGTDGVGRSMLSRLIYGGRQSLLIATVSVAAAFLIGGAIGMAVGYFRGSFDRVVAIFVDALLSVPALVFLLAVTAALRPSTRTLIIALGILAIPGIIRVSRAQGIAVSQREYILAARVMGARHLRILRRYIAPSLVMPLSTFAIILLSVLMIAEGSLSFLGVGIPPPTPSWGGMIASGQGDLATEPYLVFLPAAVLLLTVMSLTVIGERARERGGRPTRIH
jgi:peptide/nickel transport system permease protein